MNKEQQTVYCVEKLTVGTWLFYVFPCLWRNRKKNSPVKVGENIHEERNLYYIYASWWGRLFFRFMAPTVNAKGEYLRFKFFDVQGEDGDRLWWKVIFRDLRDIQKQIMQCPEVQTFIRELNLKNTMVHFIKRRILYCDSDPSTLLRMLLSIRVISLKLGYGRQDLGAVFFLSSKGIWLSEVKKWAKGEHVKVVSIGSGLEFNIRKMILRFGFIKRFLKRAMFLWMTLKYRFIKKSCEQKVKDANVRYDEMGQSGSAKIAVEFYGHLNLFSPSLQSELFFSQQVDFPKQNVMVYFQHPTFPLTDSIWREMKKVGMQAVVFNHLATTIPHVPVFSYSDKKRAQRRLEIPVGSKGFQNDLQEQMDDYQKQYDHWDNFITRHNIKLHVAWYKYGPEYLPMTEAIQNAGGASVIYQRSIENLPNTRTTVVADILFGFSRLGAHLGEDCDSTVPYYVITGYLGDHRFSLAKEEASKIKRCLRQNGAEKIITYLDENSIEDSRWNIGHKETQENYAYLLNKVLENPDLGVIFKPKEFWNLRKRLGRVAELLNRVEETGRCYIFSEGNRIGKHTPSIAALAGDIAVHGHFYAATAGVEAALTGTPTIMLDREKCSISPLYPLGLGHVIFQDWDDLWRSCQDHWKAPGGVPGFGDWSPALDDLDPFRDGRAAERMGTFLKWLLQGFDAKLPRETVLTDAAQRYMDIWGRDKVLSINTTDAEKVPVHSE